jgi:probable rRNA maturation factor
VITVEIADQQADLLLDHRRLEDAVRTVLVEAAVASAQISLAVVDDATIRRLHREYLAADEATDVLSFLLDRSGDYLEGEVIVSAQTARRAAVRFGWPPEDELLLYVIHGTLHLVGYRDATPAERAEIRRRERTCLGRLGVEARYEESDVRLEGTTEEEAEEEKVP